MKTNLRTNIMNAEEPKVALTGRYSINETSAILGINRDTLFKYTHETSEIKCGWRRVGGRLRKYYLGSEILRYWRANACL